MNVRVTTPLTWPKDPLRGAGPRLCPGIYPEEQVRAWLRVGDSELNWGYALEQGWIEPAPQEDDRRENP